jgi:hypothetical protein
MSGYRHFVLQLPIESLVVLLLLGSVLLAAWTFARFERLGPRTLGGALLAGGAGLALVAALGNVAEAIAASSVPEARFLVAVGVVVPVFTYFFLASGWLMRVVVGLLDVPR